MLGEGFLRVLPYKEEKKVAPGTAKGRRTQTHRDAHGSSPSFKSSPPGAGLIQEEFEAEVDQTEEPAPLRSVPQHSPVLPVSPVLTISLDSMLHQYPDLQVADSGLIPLNPNKTAAPQRSGSQTQREPQRVPSMPDQGYLVMGAGENISLELPGSGLEPMSNSLLNGFLEKQLEEVYLQHLTDNLARCHSHLGNSLLHGLVPPPQPGVPSQGHDSLEASLEADGGKDISYLTTSNLASNFSSPVLRISEAENPPMQ